MWDDETPGQLLPYQKPQSTAVYTGGAWKPLAWIRDMEIPLFRYKVKVNHKPLNIQVEACAAVSQISEEEMLSMFPRAQL